LHVNENYVMLLYRLLINRIAV